MSEYSYDEEFRLVATCPSCGSDRVYQTEMLARFGAPTVAAVKCADCEEPGKLWSNRDGSGWLIRWHGSKDVVPAEYALPDASLDQ